jgi:TldD protein
MHALAQRAIDAGCAAGASYVDVRLTHTVTESLTGAHSMYTTVLDASEDGGLVAENHPCLGTVQLMMGFGVRAFVHGYWGFASSPYWTADEASKLGIEAARQAVTNASVGAPRSAELGPAPSVRNGRWIMPGIDPFTVSVDEKIDLLQTIVDLASQGDRRLYANLGWRADERGPIATLQCWREERVFASSDGASYTQVRYRTRPRAEGFGLDIDYQMFEQRLGQAKWTLDPHYARGWDSLRNVSWDTVIPQLIDEARRSRPPEARAAAVGGVHPVEVGAYDVVLDARPAAAIVANTFGLATELDRALGYEADASGTSFLGPDPLEFLGTRVAADGVTITADRTAPGTLGMCMWDDEGVPAQKFPLVTDGILVDYQTNRECAQTIAPWYATRGMPVQSRGCALATTALDFPLIMRPNLVLSPGRNAVGVAEMIKNITRGIYIPSATVDVDMQANGGILNADNPFDPPREIRNGRLGAAIRGLGVLFNARDFWKSVTVLGGLETAELVNFQEVKGQPAQTAVSGVTAVPLTARKLACVDIRRLV